MLDWRMEASIACRNFIRGALLLLVLLLPMFIFAGPGGAVEGDKIIYLSVEEARRQALRYNRDLKILDVTVDQLQKTANDITAYREALEASLGPDHPNVEELVVQERQAKTALEDARHMLNMQREIIPFSVESLYTSLLLMEEQLLLLEDSLAQSRLLLEAEQAKEKEGYSSPLQVAEAASRVRAQEAAYYELDLGLREMLDKLCLLCGFDIGSKLSLQPYEPQAPKEMDLDEAMKDALDGRLVNYHERKLELAVDSWAGRRAELELEKAKEETRAAVRKAYYALLEKERQIDRAEADLELGRLRRDALAAQLEAGYITPAEAAAGPLAMREKELALLTARYQYHLSYLEFELVREGYISTAGGSGDGF